MSGLDTTAVTAASAHGHAIARPYAILALCMLAALFDGFDGQSVGFLAPAIAKDWSLPIAEFGLVFSVGLVGMIVGALGFAPLGDRHGRRSVCIAAAAGVAVFTAMTALVETAWQLAMVRFLTGAALGTMMPILVTIVHEAAPAGRRGVFVTLLVSAFPLGSFCGGMLVAWALEHVSWRAIFIVAGCIAVIFPLLFWKYLWIARSTAPAAARGAGPTVLGLFLNGWAAVTTLLWILFFASLLNTYTLSAWLPLLLTRTGMVAADAVRMTAAYSFGGAVGGILLGLATQRFGPRVLAAAYVTAALALLSLAFSGQSFGALLCLIGLIGVCIPGGHVGNNVLVAAAYPAHINATGVGWAQGLGRVGCVVGPAMVGIAVSYNVSNPGIFIGGAVIALLGAFAAAALAKRRLFQSQVRR